MKNCAILCLCAASLVSALPHLAPRQIVSSSIVSTNQTTTSSISVIAAATSSTSISSVVADVSSSSSSKSSVLSSTTSSTTSTSSTSSTSSTTSTSSTSSTSSSIPIITSSSVAPTSDPITSTTAVSSDVVSSVASQASASQSALPSVSANSTRFVHKIPPGGDPPKEMPPQIAQIAAGWEEPPSTLSSSCSYSKSSPLEACLYETYGTKAFLEAYIRSLLTFWGKSSTKDLEYAWPYYLALDFDSRTWKCSWSGVCVNPPTKPNDDSNTDTLNAFFVLESLENWNAYMQAHRKFMEVSSTQYVDSTDGELGLAGVVNQFSMSDRRPGVSLGISGLGLYTIITYSLAKMPYIGVIGEIGKAAGTGGFVTPPGPPPDTTIDNIKTDFKNMMAKWEEALRTSFLTMQVDSDYAIKLLNKGAFLKTQPKSVTDVWDNPKDWSSSQMVNYRHWTIMQTFRAYGIFLHAEDANCDSDGKWTNQNLPNQQCMTSSQFNGNRRMYIFPVSWYYPSETSKNRRAYSKFSNLSKYNLTVQGIIEKAIVNQMPTNGDWKQIAFPEDKAQQYKTPTIDWEKFDLASNVPGFWSMPVCYANDRTVGQCVGPNRCCTGFNYGRSTLSSGDCPWYASCYDWMSHFNHDNMGLDAWCAGKIGHDQGKGYYFGYQSMLYSREWRDQC